LHASLTGVYALILSRMGRMKIAPGFNAESTITAGSEIRSAAALEL
jgi:hypothetical protein